MLTGAVREVVRERSAAAELELERLEGLPCGCIVAVQRARPSLVRFVSIEAKGPYCSFPSHRTDRVLQIGDPAGWSDDNDDAERDDGMTSP
jgi:hypothetical protein